MKTKYTIYATALTATLLTACVKVELHHTPHPEKGVAAIVIEYSKKSEDANLPDNFKVDIGEHSATIEKEGGIYPNLLKPDTYYLMAYNEPDGITVENGIATVTKTKSECVQHNPGDLFTIAKYITVAADDTLHIEAEMEQRTRKLTLELNVEGNPESITSLQATLTGIASQMDIAKGEVILGSAAIIIPEFIPLNTMTRIETSPQKLEAQLNLLGIDTQAKQILTIDIMINEVHEQIIENNLTERLANFNTGGKETLRLNATLVINTKGGFSATIVDWIPGNGAGEDVGAQ